MPFGIGVELAEYGLTREKCAHSAHGTDQTDSFPKPCTWKALKGAWEIHYRRR
jgi:hypothetical protein